MLKGRQTGAMHRGHSWVFRAESYDTMLAWYNDIKELTEKRGEERNDFVRRQHARSLSGNSAKPASIISSEGGMEEDEADRIAFSGEQSVRGNSVVEGGPHAGAGGLGVEGVHDLEDNRSEAEWRPPQRPAPGGRFPSDVNVQRGLQAPLSPSSPSSGESSDREHDVIAAAGALPGSGVPFAQTTEMHTELQSPEAHHHPAGVTGHSHTHNQHAAGHHSNPHPVHSASPPPETASQYGEWMAPIAAGAGGAAVGAGVTHHHEQQQQDQEYQPHGEYQEHPQHQQHQQHQQQSVPGSFIRQADAESAIPDYGQSSAPIPIATAAPANAPTGPRAMSESTTAPSSAAANASPSGTETGTLSTVPTSTGHAPSDGSTGMFDANGVYIGPRNTTTAPTEYVVKPPDRSKSYTTVSHLHVPGEFPPTPGLTEDAKLYQEVVKREA